MGKVSNTLNLTAGAVRSRRIVAGPIGGAAPTGPEITLPEDFVRPTGGAYLFMPSLQAVQTVLAKD